MIGKETLVATSGAAAAGERGLSFQELTRKRRVAARRDKKKGQPSAAVSNDNKSVANGNKTKSEDAADAYQETQDLHAVRFPRSASQDRLFVVTGNATADKEDDGATGSQSANINHKTRKKLRWKEQWSAGGGRRGGDSRDCDEDVFTANQSACDIPCTDNNSDTRGFHAGADAIKNSDLSIATCDHPSDNKSRFEPLEGHNANREDENSATQFVNGLYGITDHMEGASWKHTESASSVGRGVPRLERQAAFSRSDYSSSDTDTDDETQNTRAVYNVDLVVKGEGHLKGQGQEVRKWSEKEDDYVPLWAVGKKVSTTIQYKSDDTYVPIWTTNVPKTKPEMMSSKSADNYSRLEGADLRLQGQGNSDIDRCPTAVPKTMSLDVSANKTTRVIQRDNLLHSNNKTKSQSQTPGQSEIDRHYVAHTSSGPHDNNRNFNGHLSKLKLVHGASDLPQVHNSSSGAKVKANNDVGERSEKGQHVDPESVDVCGPSLLERRGILLKEASSEDRTPPPLPLKYARNLRSYDQIGRSLERSKSKRLLSGTTWDQQRSTEAPSNETRRGNVIAAHDPNDQPMGTLQKLKRHLSRSKSYK